MSEIQVGTQYSWAMKDASVLARGFDTPDVLEPYTAVIVKPGQQALVFINDQQKVLRDIGTHLITGNVRVSIKAAVDILHAGGTVHTTFSSAITIFDVRSHLLPEENLTLTAADGSETHVSFSGSYRIADVCQLVTNALSLQSCGEANAHELRMSDPFLRDTVQRMSSIAAGILTQRAQDAPTAADVKRLLVSPGLSEAITRQINEAIRPAGMLLERFRASLTERACPYCHRQLSMMEIRARRCGNAEVGCNRTLEICPECGGIVSQGEVCCPRCSTALLWCDRCRSFAQVERGRFCTRCRSACYPIPPRGFLQHT